MHTFLEGYNPIGGALTLKCSPAHEILDPPLLSFHCLLTPPGNAHRRTGIFFLGGGTTKFSGPSRKFGPPTRALNDRAVVGVLSVGHSRVGVSGYGPAPAHLWAGSGPQPRVFL